MFPVKLPVLVCSPETTPNQDEDNGGTAKSPNEIDATPTSQSDSSLAQPTLESPFASPASNTNNETAAIDIPILDLSEEALAAGTSQPAKTFTSYAGELTDNSWLLICVASAVLIGIVSFWLLAKFLNRRRKKRPRLQISVDQNKKIRGQFKKSTRFASSSNSSQATLPSAAVNGSTVMPSQNGVSHFDNGEEFDFSADLDDEIEAGCPEPGHTATKSKQFTLITAAKDSTTRFNRDEFKVLNLQGDDSDSNFVFDLGENSEARSATYEMANSTISALQSASANPVAVETSKGVSELEIELEGLKNLVAAQGSTIEELRVLRRNLEDQITERESLAAECQALKSRVAALKENESSFSEERTQS